MIDAPDLDSRTIDDVVGQTEALAAAYTSGAWSPAAHSLDLGGVLIRLFGTMVDHAIKQLNRAPDKHRRAFTALLGARRIPARAARAAITFALDDGDRTTVVPAGAQISGTGTDGAPVVFETELDLAVTRARLAAVFVRDTAQARYADRTAPALGLESRAYEALGATPAPADPLNRDIEHEVSVVFDAVALRGATKITVTAGATSPLPTAKVAWSAYDGQRWAALPEAMVAGTIWTLEATAASIREVEVAGRTARWLRGSFPGEPPALQLASTVTIDAPATPLAAAFANGVRADLTRDVLPFGDRPRIGDVFYIAGDDAFATAGLTITLDVTLTVPEDGVNASPELKLQWEAWDGTTSMLLGTTMKSGVVTTSPPSESLTTEFKDTTKAFTTSGAVSFKLPAPIPRSTLHGVTSRWVRVRIVGGNYGADMTASTSDGKVTITQATFRPPALATATLKSSGSIECLPSAVLRRTALTYEDVTAGASGPMMLYRRAPELVYEAVVDTTPSLHLGFDRAFEPTLMTLYLQVHATSGPEPAMYDTAPGERKPPRIAWEYWNGQRWSDLTVEDGTRGLARSGLVRFLPPGDAAPLVQFAQALHWLRARALDSDFTPTPVLGRISVNTVWAAHAHTTRLEVLGSSSGARDQTFHLSQTPVLEGQEIDVGEPDPLPPSELARLEAVEGENAVTVDAPPGRPPLYWVRWHEVADFWASGPRDRHYTLDSATGEIRFGDGAHGIIPPKGSQNVRAACYRAGGGAAGNVAAGALAQLRTTVPIVRAAINHEPAVGGAPVEPVAAVMDRAARTLRHGGRAVTAADFADLALESSRAVARAVALTPSFSPIDQAEKASTAAGDLHRDGKVIVVIVPAAPEPGKAPSNDLLAEVEDFLRARCAPGVTVQVSGPSWVGADITVHVVGQSLGDSDAVVARTRAALLRLLDPLTGGDGDGWGFGRRPRLSDLVACINAVPGVEHLSYVDVRCDPPFDKPDASEAISIDALSLRDRLLVYPRTVIVDHPRPVQP
ncbi:MAG TPA: putative baseplate assembly protein [Kofleriaceae bacterium]